VAFKLLPEEWLETRLNTCLFEMSGGPGHVPPDMASPPVITTVEPS
jgi:hypothetical protein